MTNSEAFKLAHTMTKECIQAGDCYAVVFGQSLKIVKAQHKRKVALAKVGYAVSAALQTILIVVSLVLLALITSLAFVAIDASEINVWLTFGIFGSLIVYCVKAIITQAKYQFAKVN